MTTVLRPPQFNEGCRSTGYRRQTSRTCFNKRFGTTRSRSHRERCCLALALSITILVLSCRMTTAFVQNSLCRSHSAQRNKMMQKHLHIRQLPLLPHRRLSPLSTKNGSTEKDDSKKEWFFNRKDKDNDPKSKEVKQEDGKPKDLPIVGRFFATDEEKEEKKRIKQKETEEKERLKLQAKKEKERMKIEAKKERQRREQESKKNDDDKKAAVVTGMKNFFQERQIRKEEEILKFQAMRKDEFRKKQQEKDAEELRFAVQQREKERERKQNLAKLKIPTAPVVARSSTEDIVRRKIQTQKGIDQARKERQEKIQRAKDQFAKKETKPSSSSGSSSSSSSSKSQRLGGVVSAAQKFVSGVFDRKAEQWIVVAPKTRIAPGEIVPITAAGIDLLLVASKDGSAVHCVANSCPHLGTPLEVGSLERLPIESKTNPPTTGSKVQPLETKEFFQENDIASMLKQDGCEDCIVCPLHKTAFALKSGEVRGEWCPYPPVIGKLTGAIKAQTNLPVFDVRIKGKNIEVRLNTPVEIDDGSSKGKKKKR